MNETRGLWRGKRLDNGDWAEGDLTRYSADMGYITVDLIENEVYQVDGTTLGECTGLRDKNGKLIFEGDIVTGYFNHEKIIGYIIYGSDATFFIHRNGLYGIGLNNATDWLSVIGNIHDNVELLSVHGECGESNAQ